MLTSDPRATHGGLEYYRQTKACVLILKPPGTLLKTKNAIACSSCASSPVDTKRHTTQRDQAETVRDSAGGLQTIINDILDFSRVEAGELTLEAIDMDLRETVEDVARLLATPAHGRGWMDI